MLTNRNDLERHTLSLLQFNTGVPPSVYARYYFDLLYLGDLVSFTDLFSQPTRRRLTPRIACRMRILPDSPEVRAEQCSSSIGAAGGGGLVFDLPCRHQGNVEVVRRGRATTPLKTSTSNRQSKEIIEVSNRIGIAVSKSTRLLSFHSFIRLLQSHIIVLSCSPVTRAT